MRKRILMILLSLAVISACSFPAQSYAAETRGSSEDDNNDNFQVTVITKDGQKLINNTAYYTDEVRLICRVNAAGPALLKVNAEGTSVNLYSDSVFDTMVSEIHDEYCDPDNSICNYYLQQKGTYYLLLNDNRGPAKTVNVTAGLVYEKSRITLTDSPDTDEDSYSNTVMGTANSTDVLIKFRPKKSGTFTFTTSTKAARLLNSYKRVICSSDHSGSASFGLLRGHTYYIKCCAADFEPFCAVPFRAVYRGKIHSAANLAAAGKLPARTIDVSGEKNEKISVTMFTEKSQTLWYKIKVPADGTYTFSRDTSLASGSFKARVLDQDGTPVTGYIKGANVSTPLTQGIYYIQFKGTRHTSGNPALTIF
ncbi:MAG: hypothetical protein LKJ83_04430 [Eubacteriaceae bacterium]|jgi:hypothetical protein|nr:hypothetical protein [Eubacteriaceae bacterium]